MNDFSQANQLRPTSSSERNVDLDALRGVALLGVLLVNLHVGFRSSLFENILAFHSQPGWANHVVDILIAWLLEFKAFTLFSFLFGVGVGVQAQRAASNYIQGSKFFVRRFAALFAIGLCHMFLVWDGDILTLYAVCGFLLIPLLKVSAKWLAIAGIALVVLSPHLPFFDSIFPSAEAMRAHAEFSTPIYASGSFSEIMALRLREAPKFIAPLLLSSLPRTFGLMLVGVAAWRSGLVQRPRENRNLLKSILVVAGVLGTVTTTLVIWSKETGEPPPDVFDWFYAYSYVLLAFAYGAGLLLVFSSNGQVRDSRLKRLLASTGRMALSNYLAQSVIFSFLFYGFGFGLFGRLGPALTAALGVTVFAVQLVGSSWWLRRFQFGPAEWVWRSLTYRRWQPMSREARLAR